MVLGGTIRRGRGPVADKPLTGQVGLVSGIGRYAPSAGFRACIVRFRTHQWRVSGGLRHVETVRHQRPDDACARAGRTHGAGSGDGKRVRSRRHRHRRWVEGEVAGGQAPVRRRTGLVPSRTRSRLGIRRFPRACRRHRLRQDRDDGRAATAWPSRRAGGAEMGHPAGVSGNRGHRVRAGRDLAHRRPGRGHGRARAGTAWSWRCPCASANPSGAAG